MVTNKTKACHSLHAALPPAGVRLVVAEDQQKEQADAGEGQLGLEVGQRTDDPGLLRLGRHVDMKKKHQGDDDGADNGGVDGQQISADGAALRGEEGVQPLAIALGAKGEQ